MAPATRSTATMRSTFSRLRARWYPTGTRAPRARLLQPAVCRPARGALAAADALDFSPTARALVPDGNPSFWGGYLEAGYFLTGETRGYKNGTWDRTKVLKPFSKDGWGALQVNARSAAPDM